jgi:hypothetical protein
LVFVANTPIVLLGAPFGLDPGVLFEVLTPPMINQFACIAGGLLWAAALARVLAAHRRRLPTPWQNR